MKKILVFFLAVTLFILPIVVYRVEKIDINNAFVKELINLPGICASR